MIFVLEAVFYNILYLSRILPSTGKVWLLLPYGVTFNALWILSFWSFLMAHSSDPGQVPQHWYEWTEHQGPALPVGYPRAQFQAGQATRCSRCKKPRPERAHHCNNMGVCVLRMDHFCPWLNNCVGYYNHKFFLQLVVYGLLLAVFALASSMPQLVVRLILVFDSKQWQAGVLNVGQMAESICFMVFGVLALFIVILLGPTVFTHLPLAAKNMTSIEAMYVNAKNPYDMGSIVANLEQIFGEPGLDWLLPIHPLFPVGDGVSFALNAEAEEQSPQTRPLIQHQEGEELWKIRYSVADHATDSPSWWEHKDPQAALPQCVVS